jgi:2-hydroxychromene-2-carboxylate isomerase
MRGCIFLAPEGKLVAFSRAVFEAYWGDDRDISNDRVLAEVCASVGIDARSFFAGISQQSIKDKLRQNTDELIARGGFGSPTVYLDRDDLYFGNDRLPLVRAALERRKRKQGGHG